MRTKFFLIVGLFFILSLGGCVIPPKPVVANLDPQVAIEEFLTENGYSFDSVTPRRFDLLGAGSEGGILNTSETDGKSIITGVSFEVEGLTHESGKVMVGTDPLGIIQDPSGCFVYGSNRGSGLGQVEYCYTEEFTGVAFLYPFELENGLQEPSARMAYQLANHNEEIVYPLKAHTPFDPYINPAGNLAIDLATWGSMEGGLREAVRFYGGGYVNVEQPYVWGEWKSDGSYEVHLLEGIFTALQVPGQIIYYRSSAAEWAGTAEIAWPTQCYDVGFMYMRTIFCNSPVVNGYAAFDFNDQPETHEAWWVFNLSEDRLVVPYTSLEDAGLDE